jgi:hypothetical protein
MSNQIYIFKQGDSCKIERMITESVSVDFSSATDIFCILSIAGVVTQRYSLNTLDNYGKLEVDGVNKNQVNLFVDRSESINFGIGTLTGYLIAEFTDADFPSGKSTKSWKFSLGKVLEGEGLDIVTD